MVKISNILRLPFDHIPGPKPLPLIHNVWRYLPLIGNYKLDTLFENALYNKARYGPIVREQITPKHTVLHLFDPKDIESLVRQDGKCPHRRSHRALLKFRRERPDLYIDGGLFPENGNSWYRQRNQFQKRVLSKSYISKNSQKMDRISLKTIKKLEENYKLANGQIENFQSILYRWALSNSISLFLDIESENLADEVVESILQNLHSTLTAIDKTEIQTEKWVEKPSKCPYYQSLVASQSFLYNFVSKAVDDSMKTFSQSTQISYLYDWLVVDKLDRRDVITFIIDALLAGLHTTSYTAAFLLFHLANNQKSQDHVREEVRKYLVKEEIMTDEAVDKLVILRNSLKETMRLNPVSIGTGRLLQSNIILNNYEIPGGTIVITQNQVISRDESIYKEPEKFHPERWSHYRTCPRNEKPSPFATLPFGFGARFCIGQRIAEFQIKSLTARLLQIFQIISFEDIEVKTTLIHNINGQLKLKLKKL